MAASIGETITEFHADLATLADSEVVGKYVLTGSARVLDDGAYYELKRRIGAQFEMHETQVYLVGSAKTGFSIAPHKRYRRFGEESDLDVALVSDVVFVRYWRQLAQHAASGGLWDRRTDFEHYLLQGWIRPDVMPDLELTHQWWDFFRDLTNSGDFGPYKIAAGLYYSVDFLEEYQCNCVRLCRRGD